MTNNSYLPESLPHYLIKQVLELCDILRQYNTILGAVVLNGRLAEKKMDMLFVTFRILRVNPTLTNK